MSEHEAGPNSAWAKIMGDVEREVRSARGAYVDQLAKIEETVLGKLRIEASVLGRLRIEDSVLDKLRLDEAILGKVRFADSLINIQESVLGKLTALDLGSDLLGHLARQQFEIRDSIAEFERELLVSEDDVRLLAQCGWTLPMWAEPSFPVRVMNDVGRTPPNVAELDAAFELHYTERDGVAFDEMATDLVSSEGLAPWRRMLSECVSAYRRNEFNVPVPALFTILEGAAIVVAGTPAKKEPVGPMKAAADDAQHAIELLIRVSILEFLAALFASSDFSKGEPTRPNRHWVLHGRSRRLFTRLDCIRLFHALHTLSHEIET